MNDTGLHEDERLTGGGLKAWQLLLIAAAAVALIAVLFRWYGGRPEAPPPADVGEVTEVPEGSRTVTLFFAAEEDAALISQTRQVAIGMRFEEQVRQVIRSLIAGPGAVGASTIPEGTELLDVFYDPEGFTVYLDFSDALVAAHPGGATAEYFTIAAIVRTVSENFPEVQAVQILIEGSQVGTIGGHINADDPFLVRDWR